MSAVISTSLARHRSRRRQDPPASRLVHRQLCRRRHHAADRRREPVRGARPARGRARARRRRRQRQCHAGGRAPLVRGDLHRLRALAARVRPRARAGRRPHDPVPGGRRREPALRRRVVRRGAVHLRRDVHAEPGPGGERARARVQARRQDRPGQLDARELHRPAVQDHRQVRPARAGRQVTGTVGHAGTAGGAVRRPARARSAPPAASSPSATARRRTGSRCSAPTTAR